MRVAPASGGATSDRPGMNLATISTFAPQRSKLDWVSLTQVSGVREMRHSSFMTRPPNSRPATYQVLSPIRQATHGQPEHRPAAAGWPSAAMAPATTSVGTAGSGRPSWSHSTLTKTTPRPIGLSTAGSCPADGRRDKESSEWLSPGYLVKSAVTASSMRLVASAPSVPSRLWSTEACHIGWRVLASYRSIAMMPSR